MSGKVRVVFLAALLVSWSRLVAGWGATPAVAGGLADSPITHVVVIYQENHSFNEMLGKLCVQEADRCVGTTQGRISDGTTIQLAPEPDVVPDAGHRAVDQEDAINGGSMNGWDHVGGCTLALGYPCLSQVQAGATPTLWTLADAYALSDMTFESNSSSSWGSHIQLVAATLDGFVGDQPFHALPGTGCNSGGDVWWSSHPGGKQKEVPSCIPNSLGEGPYRASPVRYVPTIMDRMESAGRSWHLYAPGPKNAGYGWAICPTFFECLGGPQASKVRQPHDFTRDAAKGKLAQLSLVIPYFNDSQHNGYSLRRGDNWIARNVAAVMNGPEWDSTAIFITYDDCGCFYDPVLPPPGQGIREPMVIVSPYARPYFVDHTVANHASMLAFVEHLLGLPPLNQEDATAYDYANAFDFSQRPLTPVRLPLHAVPRSSRKYIAAHPRHPDDPT